MPADIAMIDELPAMAYQGETPWHQLGTPMHEADVPKALEAARLNWTVSTRPVFYKDTDDELRSIDDRLAVVRDHDGQLLGVVSDSYHVKQNAEVFGVLQPACEKFGLTIETAGALGKGQRVWMLAKLPEDITPIPGDTIKGYSLIISGHDGRTPHTGRLTNTRVVCANTLALALRDQAFMRLNHIGGDSAEQLEQMARMITKMVAALKASGETFKQLAAKRLSATEIEQYVNAVLEVSEVELTDRPVIKRRRDRIVQLSHFGKGVELAPGSAWAALNAVTEYVDHVRPAELKTTKSKRAANVSALFGQNAMLKSRALAIARQLAA